MENSTEAGKSCLPQDLAKPLSTLLALCSGPDGWQWVSALERFVGNENPWEGFRPQFPIWNTVLAGKTELDIAVVQLYQLGFRDIVRDLNEIYLAAGRAGLALCPEDAVRPIDKAYVNRDGRKTIHIGTVPITRKKNAGSHEETTEQVIFDLQHTISGKNLCWGVDIVDSYWHIDDRFAFVIPRKNSA